ncbi:MAG: nicotinate-nucleotide adenylyltransferase [Candidatus Kapaibacteriales bacterium]
MKRIGLFGGTFSPVHFAHLIIAERFVEQLGLDKCYLMPCNVSPFKADKDTVHYLPKNEDRLAMLQMAVEGNENLIVDDYELKKGGISYTIETVKYLKEKYSDAKLYFLVGSDQARQFKKWKEWKDILKISTMSIAIRPETKYDKRKNEDITDLIGIEPLYIDCPRLDISSSEIRYRIANRQNFNYLMPRKVQNYIESNSLYENIPQNNHS